MGTRRSTGVLIGVLAAGILATMTGLSAADEIDPFGTATADSQNRWQLLYQESFDEPLLVDDAPWVRDPHGDDSPWHVDHLDDDGEFWHIRGGEDFQRHLDSFGVLRKRVSFGDDGWLTAELAARDNDQDGVPDAAPSLRNVTVSDGDQAALLDEPSHDGGILVRPTNELPPQYRIEVTLKDVDFGGMRHGSFEHDGRVNGYSPEGCKTNYPWKRSGSYAGPADPCNSNFNAVRSANGYYFLSIVDYQNPAPHNNTFIHTHRKVNIDAYNVMGSEGNSYWVCNPANGEIYNYNSAQSTRNGVNEIFMSGDRFQSPSFAYTGFIMETECGTATDRQFSILSAAEIQPDLMPEESYKFAIERLGTGYATEMSGNFLHVGDTTLRYYRDFIQEDGAIWHYNNTPEEYDGRFNSSLTFTGPFGQYTVDDLWPTDSAYPDYFIIGDPHLNYYEGSAIIDDIRLYVPVPECDLVVSGSHSGPLAVDSGVTCLETGATVTGPVTVEAGAALVADGAKITGPINAKGAELIWLCNTNVKGPVNLKAGYSVTVGDPAAGCAPNTITGPVTATDTIGPSVISGNSITGPLSCTGNSPPPVNNGTANTVAGPKIGQCAAL